MHVLLVRHGETEGNRRNARQAIRIAKGEFETLEQAKEYARAERLKLSEEEAQGDTRLSERGTRQAQWLAEYWSTILLEKAKDGDVEMYVSPMRRCLQTAKPLVDAMKLREVHVDARIFEVPGLCHSKDRRDFLEDRILPLIDSSRVDEAISSIRSYTFERCGLSRRDILKTFPYVTRFCGGMERENVNTKWWRGGFESERETKSRIESVKRWLIERARSPAARGKVVVLVSHGDTIWRLTKTLLGIEEATTAHSLQNTSLTCFGIASDGKISCKFVNRCPHLLRAPNDRQSKAYYKFQNIMKRNVRKGAQRDLNAFYTRTTALWAPVLSRL
eukprot:g2457.t1